jgi:C4-dicarboxylate transporter DctM subunit
MTEALVGLLAMMVIAFLRIPLALSMGIVGIVGYAYMRDWSWGSAFATAQTKIYETGRNYTLSVVPLFILMGNFVTRAGMSQELYRAAYAFIGHLRGGLAMATIVGCAGFGAICGSSIATAATFAKVAYPSMKKFGYSDSLATGAIASGGTLGILIPPSTIMVIYGIMTGTSIGKLFAAGILPGILATVLLCLAVQYMTWRDPKAGPRGERLSWKERFATLEGLWWFVAVGVAVVACIQLGWLASDDAAVLGALAVFGLSLVYKGITSVVALFVLVMGGIYGGVFTPTEAAAVAAVYALFAAVFIYRDLKIVDVPRVLTDSGRVTVMLMFIIANAFLFGHVLTTAQIPQDIARLITAANLEPWQFLLIVNVILLVAGNFMEPSSIVLITAPILFPAAVQLGIDPIHLGIVYVVNMEIGLVTPPVGLNLFVASIITRMPILAIVRAAMPWLLILLGFLVVVTYIPELSLFLPNRMFGQALQ